jgi:hypothetical protein
MLNLVKGLTGNSSSGHHDTVRWMLLEIISALASPIESNPE